MVAFKKQLSKSNSSVRNQNRFFPRVNVSILIHSCFVNAFSFEILRNPSNNFLINKF